MLDLAMLTYNISHTCSIISLKYNNYWIVKLAVASSNIQA